MKTTKWLRCALAGLGLSLPIADVLATSAAADETNAVEEAATVVHQSRRDRHNRQWRKAKSRAHQQARRGQARDVVRAFKKELNHNDIVVNVCVINVINKADSVVAVGGDVYQVINIIDGANCEIR